MGMNLTVQLRGMDAVSLQVKYLSRAAQLGLKLGVSEAAGLFEEEAKSLVPVLTGNLRDHIHTEVVTDQPETQVRAVTPVVEASNPYGFDPPYARRIEEGFIGTDALGRNYHQSAQPYMRPAFDNKREEAEAAIKDSVFESLNEAMNTVAAGRH